MYGCLAPLNATSPVKVTWNNETLAEVRQAVAELRASGQDSTETPASRFLVMRIGCPLYQEIADDLLAPLLPIPGEPNFICSF